MERNGSSFAKEIASMSKSNLLGSFIMSFCPVSIMFITSYVVKLVGPIIFTDSLNKLSIYSLKRNTTSNNEAYWLNFRDVLVPLFNWVIW